jgi:predicted Zn finger-like uncharacterized protein
MKFVCDNCQAKYQIGDDKVAGKTVRMKCRKCGYNIKVSASGTADATPPDPPSHEGLARDAIPAPPVSMLQAVTPASSASSASDSPGWTEGDEESTSIMNAPVREAVAAALAASKPSVSQPSAPRPLASQPAGRTPAPAPARPAPPAPRPVTTGAPRPPPAAQPRPVTRAPVAPVAPGLTRPGYSSSSLAAVHHEPTPPQPPAAAELEWYVGIAGSPIGPVRVAVIRERAAAGDVDGESLVWREGQAEWRPLRTFPDLLAVVTAARAPAPAPTPTPFAAMSALSAPVGAPVAAAPAPVAAAPAPVAAAPAPTPAPVAAAPAAAAAAPVQQPVAPVAPAPSPFIAAPVAPVAPVPPAPSALADPFAPAPNGAPKSNGFHTGALADAPPPAVAPAAPKPAAPLVDIDPALEAALIPRRGNTHPMAYAFIAAAAVFGGVAAYVLLSKPAVPQILVVQAPPTAGTATAAPSVVADDKGSVDVGDPLITPGSTAHPALGKPWPKSSGAATAPSAAAHDTTPLDTSGIITNVPGPQATAPSGPSAGGTLSQGEMNSVVAQNQPRVRRRCWQPALDGQAANGPKNARIMVAITIGASGNVDSASASGSERDFPGLATCIAGMVRGWKFPPSGSSTQVNVPFVFAGQ